MADPSEKCNYDFPNLGEGDGRNQTLFNYILTLQSDDFTKEEARECIRLINRYVLKKPLSDKELEVILRDDASRKHHSSGIKPSCLISSLPT